MSEKPNIIEAIEMERGRFISQMSKQYDVVITPYIKALDELAKRVDSLTKENEELKKNRATRRREAKKKK